MVIQAVYFFCTAKKRPTLGDDSPSTVMEGGGVLGVLRRHFDRQVCVVCVLHSRRARLRYVPTITENGPFLLCSLPAVSQDSV